MGEIIDKTKLDKGIIEVNYKPASGETAKVVIEKDGTSYNYAITKNMNIFPLQLGNGNYKITLAQLISGKQYKVLQQESVSLQLKDSNDVYLQSIQNVAWKEDMDIIKKAKDLTRNAKSNLEKANIIHDYITHNIKYDYDRQKTVVLGHIPSVEETSETKSGICYDFASITAGMLRSLGIPTKLETGDSLDITGPHAWNRVYLAETKEWIILDTAFDSVYVANNQNVKMIKDPNRYTTKKIY